MKIALTLITSLLVSGASLAEPYPISSYYIPGLVDGPNKGVMVDMLNKIEQHSGIEFQLSLNPTLRVQRDFANGFLHGYFPELEEFLPESGYCRSIAFMRKKIFSVVRKGEPVITSIDQLEGKSVGAVAGYSYGTEIINNPNIELIRVDKDETNVRKLLAGRIDVIAGDTASTIAAIKRLNAEDAVTYDAHNPVDLLDVFFVFRDDEIGKEHCTRVSAALEKLKQDGYLYKQFGDY